MTALNAKITGTGMYVPDKVITNQDLESMMETTDEWIQQRSGIQERRIADEGWGPSELAHRASLKALEAAGLKAEDLDLILFATLSPDYYFPGSAVFLQDMLGLEDTPAMDVRCQCSGFLYSLSTAKAFIQSGQYKKILIVGAEVHSRGIEYATRGRDVTVLFGDGAGALVVEATDEPETGVLSVELHSEGKYRDKLKMEFPSMRTKPFVQQHMIDDGLIWPTMEGRFVFKHAVRRMPEVVRSSLEANNLKPDDIDHYLFHQANLRINEAALKELGQPMEKSYNNIQKYGNCSAASIPMCIDECVRSGRIKKGDLVCMASFGAGFTWAGAVVRW